MDDCKGGTHPTQIHSFTQCHRIAKIVYSYYCVMLYFAKFLVAKNISQQNTISFKPDLVI